MFRAFAPMYVSSTSTWPLSFFCERSSLHSKANSVDHEPRRFLRDTERPVNVVRANAVFAIDDHPNGSQPLVQTERRILEDGADFNGELSLLVRALALPLVLLLQKRHVFASAGRAFNAVRPSARGKIIQAI